VPTEILFPHLHKQTDGRDSKYLLSRWSLVSGRLCPLTAVAFLRVLRSADEVTVLRQEIALFFTDGVRFGYLDDLELV
jgi:hypothetical protein